MINNCSIIDIIITYIQTMELYGNLPGIIFYYIYVLHWKQCTYVQAWDVTQFKKLATINCTD